MKKWNPRYVAFAKSQGRTPDTQVEHDRKQWPGGCMCGFILWISKMVRAFRKASPRSFTGWHVSDHAAFTKFLESEASK